MRSWHLIGTGDPNPTCGSPQAYHEFSDGARVWGPAECSRRDCPICCDRSYIVRAADDITRTVQGWVASLLAQGRLYDANGHSLKIYHFIYSRRKDDDNLKLARKESRKDLENMGMLAGYSILHPFRGKHGKDDTPAECRVAMDTSKLSIHLHGVAIGYWSERGPLVPHERYVRTTSLMDIRSWIHNDQPVVLRKKLLKFLQYDLGHTGYHGDHGQSVTSWGSARGDRKWAPEKPEIYIQHPTITEDGDPVWERVKSASARDLTEELRGMISASCGISAEKYDEQEYLPDISGGSVGPDGLYPWYALHELKREEWHHNWYPWRTAVALAVSSLISPP